MARVPLIDGEGRPELKELIHKIAGARQGRLINVYKVLLNSPRIANAWVDFNSTVRDASTLTYRSMELTIIRIAILTKTEYIFRAHVPGYATEAGLTPEDIDGLWDWPNYAKFDAKDRAMLAFVDANTRDVDVPDAIAAEAAKHFDPQAMVDLAVLIGAYNMHARVTRGLRTDLQPAWDLSAAKWRG